MHQVHVVHPHLKLLHIQMTKLPNQLCLCGWFDLVISEFSFRMSPFSLVRFRQLQYNRQH